MIIIGLLPELTGKDNPAVSKTKTQGTLPQFQRGLKHLFPDFASLEKIQDKIYRIKSKDQKELGLIFLEFLPMDKKKKGYAGPIEVAVVFQQQKVFGVLIGKNRETPRFLRYIAKKGLLKSWNGATLNEIPDKKVDAVTRATLSSNAIIESVLKLAEEHLKQASDKK